MPDFPAAVPDLPDATVSETLFTMHTNIGHVPATNRILLNLRALAGKLGIGASTPSGAGVLRQSGVAGTTAWGQVQPGDISPGTGNANRSLLVNPGGTAVTYAAVPSGGLVGAGAGSPNTVARTTDGTNVVYGKVATGDILDGTILPADIAPGAASSVLQTNAGGVVAWLTSLLVSGSIQAGGKLFPSGQTNVGFDVPVNGVVLASAGSTLIGTNARMGLAVVIDAGSGQSAIYVLAGSAQTAIMIAGNAALFDVVGAINSKINVFWHAPLNGYLVYNGYATGGHPVHCLFFGIGT